jgi:hypothetical protein
MQCCSGVVVNIWLSDAVQCVCKTEGSRVTHACWLMETQQRDRLLTPLARRAAAIE